ncbi:conserved Plasmodium protein, unknown function [Plasmodium knowlesi strain H]|uniref:5-formyltetrahydrofolate cyclo-ligase n=3 Tax=Plasmodium knowlesi TaxID=5850 RepID=A0A5K1VTU6_PLAKH|nr:5-formyltetrahydrofolate cyclo-ligase, putative [Plasmodium knowlesi strain H]OTN63823.1 Uncharacterized protein PKNOH_S140283400 [Plasmodium knowlesi]CAA9991244.1 5-formyltetrahydrofolate cyclo-ligase, putative [Plasmodium knowlesi strain H]SBO26321.1 conserved Plasmodium protein, unknown function [Plasmodium knowlesi strain H]SBO29048.1 conserved Plasmodium protein, unknown function [Plasmodium knowlesi strain H]VVS80718.1 5-formyltetrahydrofolate cyclo-ligase, putative [Plasmodium knowle|eukprot:XP_002262523.1 hypothetical protein, conserved in Plasmodium species [Plasmodium knowlesi strain H]
MWVYPFAKQINEQGEEDYTRCITPVDLRDHYKNYKHSSSNKQVKHIVRRNAKQVRDVVLTSWLPQPMDPHINNKDAKICLNNPNGGTKTILYVDFVYTQLIRYTYVLLHSLNVNRRKEKKFNFSKIFTYKCNYKLCEEDQVGKYLDHYNISNDLAGCAHFFMYSWAGEKKEKKKKKKTAETEATEQCKNKANFNMCIYLPTEKEVDILFIFQKLHKYFYFNLYVPIITDQNSLIFFPFDLRNNLLVKHRFGIFVPYLYVHYCAEKGINRGSNLPLNLSSANLVMDTLYNFSFTEKENIFFIPLLAYNNYGARVGSGKGYYDRALNQAEQEKKKKNVKVSISLEVLMYEIDFLEPTDILLDYVVNERGVYHFVS